MFTRKAFKGQLTTSWFSTRNTLDCTRLRSTIYMDSVPLTSCFGYLNVLAIECNSMTLHELLIVTELWMDHLLSHTLKLIITEHSVTVGCSLGPCANSHLASYISSAVGGQGKCSLLKQEVFRFSSAQTTDLFYQPRSTTI